MTTATTTVRATSPEVAARLAERLGRSTRPRLGGLNGTLLRLEIRRLLRNPRTLLTTVGLPIFLYLMIASPIPADEPYGRANVGLLVLVGLAMWGACASTATVGAGVAVERAAGWSRQLRLTPLTSVAYVASKTIAGMLNGAIAIIACYLVAWARGTHMPLGVTVASAVIVLLGSGIFAAFGLLVGYLLPTVNAMQVVSLGMTAFCFLGGLFTPINDDSFWGHVSRFTPMWGARKLALSPFGAGDFGWLPVTNVVFWAALFIGGAAWRMSRDTARV